MQAIFQSVRPAPECDCDDCVAGWGRPIQRQRTQQTASHTQENYVCFFKGRGILLIKSCPVAHYCEVVWRSILVLFISICSGLGRPSTSHFSAFFKLPFSKKPSQSLASMFFALAQKLNARTHARTHAVMPPPGASPGDRRMTAASWWGMMGARNKWK